MKYEYAILGNQKCSENKKLNASFLYNFLKADYPLTTYSTSVCDPIHIMIKPDGSLSDVLTLVKNPDYKPHLPKINNNFPYKATWKPSGQSALITQDTNSLHLNISDLTLKGDVKIASDNDLFITSEGLKVDTKESLKTISNFGSNKILSTNAQSQLVWEDKSSADFNPGTVYPINLNIGQQIFDLPFPLWGIERFAIVRNGLTLKRNIDYSMDNLNRTISLFEPIEQDMNSNKESIQVILL